ncbi:homeobox-leucine zipper protein ROC5 isoform X2 [Beta vulgaris subsp. vulgaris]|uniref:homeobox-leucine zipper protein ROC5 isoform X2 n=1 Tax=Beta vulgaris subsp. vulgaris TaxID=3555 RepID=UPI002036BD3B|nr:homeobox-leucine zipper protein ROC5 isoform X2 [Beta vulgaris subsp. vulgaris]
MGKMEGQEEMGFYGDQFDTNNIIGREKEDSGSDNYDTVSVEDVPEGASQIKVKGRRKRYHRHTPQQIQELENFFKNCAHPDEKQRLEIGRRLGLESRQVKFWFQNRRTQLKTQMERHENVVLKQEYDKLRIENIAIKDAMRSPLCQSCGGPAMLGELSMDQHHLRVENSRLKDELTRVCALAERFLGKPITDVVGPISLPGSNSSLELSMGRGGLSGFMSSPASLPMGHNLENGVSSNSTMTNSMSGPVSTEYEKTMFMQAAMAAMDELLAMAQTDSPLWFKGLDDGKELLNHEEYLKKFSGFIGMRPCGFITDASRETGSVFITSSELVDTMMFPRRWQDMFPCTISKATTVEVLFNGAGGNRDGELQLMNAEFVFPSPFVPFRQEKILRYCKQHSEGMWAVVDVSVDMIREPSFSGSSIKSRRLPSGCIVQDVANGYSLVTWIEHVEYDENCIHQLYRPLLRSGMAFGAQRWLATLQRERDCAAIFMSSRIFPEDTTGAVTQEGRRSILKLMRRISNNFCSGLCASSACRWEKLQVGGLGADVCVMSRVSIDEPGEPSGVVLSASTSVWLPVTRQHLFDFLKDEKLRGKWDILANGGPMEVIARLSKSHDGNNCVALLCPPAAPARESNMLILQESWTDRTSSFIVYAPVDSTSMESVLRGGDSDYLALLPSGFAIADAAILPNVLTLANDNGDGGGTGGRGASALTLGFQILVNSLPTAKLTVESINTVNDLMSCTIQKIRDSLGVN